MLEAKRSLQRIQKTHRNMTQAWGAGLMGLQNPAESGDLVIVTSIPAFRCGAVDTLHGGSRRSDIYTQLVMLVLNASQTIVE